MWQVYYQAEAHTTSDANSASIAIGSTRNSSSEPKTYLSYSGADEQEHELIIGVVLVIQRHH
jgi:hypothetical protein